MAFPLTLPTNVFPEDVQVVRRTAAAVATSPTTYTQQVYQHPGERWEVTVKLQEMGPAEAAEWTQFFFDIKGQVGTFNMNLNAHCPGLTPAPGVVRFRMASPDVGWSSKLAIDFGFSFSAVEDK